MNGTVLARGRPCRLLVALKSRVQGLDQRKRKRSGWTEGLQNSTHDDVLTEWTNDY
jgi:hypothetical protein